MPNLSSSFSQLLSAQAQWEAVHQYLLSLQQRTGQELACTYAALRAADKAVASAIDAVIAAFNKA